MEEDDYKEKYNRYKLVVKCWENDFKKKYKRVPSKVSFHLLMNLKKIIYDWRFTI